MTFSIVAADLEADPPEWGVAVASKFLAAGAVVPWARAGVGALATQALANISYGPEGLDLLEQDLAATGVVRRLTAEDDGRADRQLGVVDASGQAATYTGDGCFEWAGGRSGAGYCCQGNILTGGDVVDRMSQAFEAAQGELAVRLLAALAAGDEAGGDRRGRQSAALLVVREGGGYGGGTDKSVDLRVDDHPAPIPELERLLGVHGLLFPRPEDLHFIAVDDGIRAELIELLAAAGAEVKGDISLGGLRDALFAYTGTENLEERWTEDPDVIERGVLEHLRAAARDP